MEQEPTAPPRGWFARRIESAHYELFCDDQANEHYGVPTSGFSYRVWRVRVFFRGFFAKLTEAI